MFSRKLLSMLVYGIFNAPDRFENSAKIFDILILSQMPYISAVYLLISSNLLELFNGEKFQTRGPHVHKATCSKELAGSFPNSGLK